MKRITALLTCAALVLSLAACSRNSSPVKNTDGTSQAQSGDNTAAEPASEGTGAEMSTGTEAGSGNRETGIIVSDGGKENILVSTGKTGLLSMNLKNTAVKIDSEEASFSKLRNGMTVDFTYGVILETYPGQVTPATLDAAEPEDGNGDICSLYAKVIEDLWNEDTALNDNGDNVFLCLEGAPGVTGGQIEAVAYLTGNITGKNVVQTTMKKLKEKGSFDEEKTCIKDGCYIEISGSTDSDSKITFTAMKYVGGHGAVFFNDCTAKKNGRGEWKYTPGSSSIS